MKTVKTNVARAFATGEEIELLLRKKTKMKLRLELTDLLFKLKESTTAASHILNQLFEEHGIVNGNGTKTIPRFKGGLDATDTEVTEGYKEAEQVYGQDLEFEFGGISLDLLGELEVGENENYPYLTTMIFENGLDKNKEGG